MRLRPLIGRGQRFLERTIRRLRRTDRRVVTLQPPGEPIARALLSYIVDPFLLPPGSEPPYSHTHYWESLTMGRTLAALGFRVEVVHWTNRTFLPREPVDLLIDVRLNLERLAPAVGPGCLKVFHAETAHWRTNNRAQRARLAELEARRGIRLTRLRLVEENRAIETADCATVLGNEWTQATFRPFGKPIYHVPLSNAFTYPSPEDKDFAACRGRFLWFGGVGFVHKGLDRVLDALAGQDGLALAVAAPLDREPDFAAAYGRELYATPNVQAIGWLDVASPRFLSTSRAALGLLFPSCSEGGGGSAITAMHAGLIPVLTRETSVDLDPGFGVLLPDAGVESIRQAARELSGRPTAELRSMAMAAWRRARERHTRDQFRTRYRTTLLEILERFRPELRRRVGA